MVEIGGMPILWHIMKIFSHYGINDFVVCAGYKQEVIKEYFANYALHNSDVTFDFSNGGEVKIHSDVSEPWKVTVVDTGLNTMTGGRIKRIQKCVGNEPFFMTYGDGVANVDINALLTFHKKSDAIVTMTAIQSEGLLASSILGKTTSSKPSARRIARTRAGSTADSWSSSRRSSNTSKATRLSLSGPRLRA